MLQLMLLWLDLQPKLQLKSQLATQGATGLPAILAQLQLQVQLQVKVCAKAVNTRTKKKRQLGATPFDYDSSCNWSFQKPHIKLRMDLQLKLQVNLQNLRLQVILQLSTHLLQLDLQPKLQNWRDKLQLSFSCKFSCKFNCKWRLGQKWSSNWQRPTSITTQVATEVLKNQKHTSSCDLTCNSKKSLVASWVATQGAKTTCKLQLQKSQVLKLKMQLGYKTTTESLSCKFIYNPSYRNLQLQVNVWSRPQTVTYGY
jgi:hypothetical protein